VYIYLHFRNSADINQHVNIQKSVASSDSDANIAHIYSSIYRL